MPALLPGAALRIVLAVRHGQITLKAATTMMCDKKME
jgi:hypothetical protein